MKTEGEAGGILHPPPHPRQHTHTQAERGREDAPRKPCTPPTAGSQAVRESVSPFEVLCCGGSRTQNESRGEGYPQSPHAVHPLGPPTTFTHSISLKVRPSRLKSSSGQAPLKTQAHPWPCALRKHSFATRAAAAFQRPVKSMHNHWNKRCPPPHLSSPGTPPRTSQQAN